MIGRQFYKCGSSTCNFFLWADEGGNDSEGGPTQAQGGRDYNQPRSRGGPAQGGRGFNQSDNGNENSVNCNCGQDARK